MADTPKGRGIPSSKDRYIDPMVAAYMKDTDLSLLRENLMLTPAERFEKFEKLCEFAMELRRAGDHARAKKT